MGDLLASPENWRSKYLYDGSFILVRNRKCGKPPAFWHFGTSSLEPFKFRNLGAPSVEKIFFSVANPTDPTIEKPRSLSKTAIQEFRPKNPMRAKNQPTRRVNGSKLDADRGPKLGAD